MAFLTEAANQGSIATGYDIDNSVNLEADNTENLTRTPSSASNQKTWTWSGWVKYTEPDLSLQTLWAGGTGSGDGSINFRVDAGTITVNTASTALRSSTAKFRDPSAWYHFVLVMDTTQSTANDRVKVYVNGSQITDFSATNNPSLNADMGVNSAQLHALGRRSNSADRYFSGYMAEVNFVDGTSLAPTAFGEFDDDSGIWKPKAYTGSYGTNGFYLDFESSGSLGADSSGNGNNFTENNITAADQATDTPTNNFCTLNPLWTFGNTMGVSDGGTKVNNTVIAWGGAKGSIGVNSGKWYWEHGSFSGNDTMFGIQNQAGGGNTQAYLDPYTLAIQANSNVIQFTDPSNRTEAFTKTFSITDIWGVALDLDANTIAFYRNGSIVNSAFSIDGLIGNGEFFPFVTHYGSGLNSRVNFGGYTGISISTPATDENGYGTFEYAPPSGYYALCTKNLAEYG